MKKKLQKVQRHKLIFEDVLKQCQKEDVAFFGKCTKFRDETPQTLTLERALQFLWLKEKKVDRKVALEFGKRRVCKIDSTMKYDGPSSARIIKTSKIDQGMINGWHNGTVDTQFDMGPQYNRKKLDKNEDEIEYEEIIKQEQQSPSDYKVKLNHQEKYNTDLSEKYSFSNMDPEILVKKLYELKQCNKSKSEQPQEYVEVEGQKFYHILNDIQDYLDKKIENKTLIQEMRAFQTFYPITRKLQVKQVNPGDPLSGMNDMNIEHQDVINKITTTSRQFDRKRTYTNMKSDQFNTNNYVFHVREVPNIIQQIRKNHFSQLIDELRKNGMRTPKEINEITPENSVKISQKESSENDNKITRKFYLKFPKSKVESSQTTSHTKSHRIGTLQSQTSQQYQGMLLKASVSNIHASSTEIRLDSPNKFKTRLDQRIDKFVKNFQNNQNSNIQQSQNNVDVKALREKYKSIKNDRDKEIRRMFKSQQIHKTNNQFAEQF